MEEFLRANSQSVGKPKKKKKLKLFIWLFVLIVVGVVAWVAITSAIAFRNATSTNTGKRADFLNSNGAITPEQLKKEGQTRINILAIGLAEKGGTDTIQVVSVDPINNTQSMISLPRDLYVKNPTGYFSRINEVYVRNTKKCTSQTANCDPRIDYGAKALKEAVETVLGIDIHYFGKVDFMGLVKIVDAVGGITVNNKTTLSDKLYPCLDNPNKSCGYYLSAGVHKLDGYETLKYVRCRKGTCNNDFGRSERQQEVIQLLSKKIISFGVLSNPKKITDIISITGNHLRTDLTISEISQLLEIVNKASSEEGTSFVLDNSAEEGLLKAFSLSPYYLAPVKGLSNYSAIHEKVAKLLPEPYIIKEKAKVTIVNASGVVGEATKLKKTLTDAGYVVAEVTEALSTQTKTTVSTNNDKMYTVALLKLRVNGEDIGATTSPTSDITVTLGTSYLDND